MKIEDLSEDIRYIGPCHDCGAEVNVNISLIEGKIVINGGAVYKIKQGIEERIFLKCDSCFTEDSTLRNWNRCEVYTRVVGYLRPVNQYNIGKKEEYKMRKEFANTKGL